MILLRLLFLIYFTNATYVYFERDSYEIFISESTKVYTKIALIKAISFPTLSIQYELHGDTNKTFYLNSLTGELILLNPVDYETIQMYKLTVEAHSLSTIPPSYTELIVYVLNVNDNPPNISLVVYPSVLYKSQTVKYDLNTNSTPIATINVKDYDVSTKNLSLYLNDTENFQIQSIRETKSHLISILSTKNNSRLIHKDDYYLLLTSCDNDQPMLCTNKTYKFHMKSNEYLCNLSFSQKTYIIDIKENTPIETFLMHKITNKYCRNITFSIDDTKNFYVDSLTGDLFTLKKFNRTEQSVFIINLFVHNHSEIKIIVRITDEHGNLPFLITKYASMNQRRFQSAHLFNSTLCRAQTIIENYFQLLSNCTILPWEKPPIGKYLFNIELEQRLNYMDTFLLELKNDQDDDLAFKNSQRIIIITIIISILFIIGLVIALIIVIKQKRYKFMETCRVRKKPSSLSINNNRTTDRIDGLSTASKLKVYDDHESSLSFPNTTVYLVQKPSPPISSLSPLRDDEGYSGSSNVSENHSPLESTVMSVNSLIEQYHIHEFPNRSSRPPRYDISIRHNDDPHKSTISPSVTLV